MSYYVLIEREQKGPYSKKEILQKIKDEEVASTDYCWKKGMEGWEPIEKVISLGKEIETDADSNVPDADSKKTKTENSSIEKKSQDTENQDDEIFELRQGRFKHAFAVFALFLFFICGIFLAFNGKILIGIILSGAIAILLYKTKGKILKRNPRLRIHQSGVDFFGFSKTITVPWEDISKVSIYDFEFQGQRNWGLEFFLINEDYYLSQYPPLYKLITKNINKLVSLISKEGTTSPFKIDFLGIGQEEETEPALAIAQKYLSLYGNPDSQKEKTIEEEDMQISWVGWSFYGIAFLDFALSWIGVLLTPFDWSPVLFGALGISYDRFVSPRENFSKLHKNLIGGGALALALLFIIIVDSSDNEDGGSGDGFSAFFEDERVTQVKESIFSDLDESLTVGSAFDKHRFFADTSWEAFEDEQGRQVIEFQGDINLDENSLFKRWQFWIGGPSDEEILQHCEEMKEDSPEFLLASGRNINKELALLSMISVGLTQQTIEIYKKTGVPEFEAHFVTQFTLSALDDTIERSYEGVKLRCHYKDFDKTREYPDEEIIHEIYQNEEPTLMVHINKMLNLEFLPFRVKKLKKN